MQQAWDVKNWTYRLMTVTDHYKVQSQMRAQYQNIHINSEQGCPVNSTGSGQVFLNRVIKLCVTQKSKNRFASQAMPHIGKHFVGFLSGSFQFDPRRFHMADVHGGNCFLRHAVQLGQVIRCHVFFRSFLKSFSHLLPTGRFVNGCHLYIFFTMLDSSILFVCPNQLNL